jgi:membrane glycosyltransferase
MECADASGGSPAGEAPLALAVAFRRIVFGACVLATIVIPTTMLVAILRPLSPLGFVLAAAFLVNITWIALGFWNALFGFCILRVARRAPESSHDAILARTAIAMVTYNEDGRQSVLRLRAIKKSVDATDCAAMFDYFLLSDSSAPDAAASEEDAFSDWQRHDASRHIHYRRRSSNWGFKPGNIREFCATHGASYDYLILLDADSLMDGQTIARLVRIMQRNPRLGILQTLIVGVLCPSAFARIFEFGHRNGLRCSIAGAQWWQADRCQYWGHNAVIRLKPFAAFCEMPYLSGKGPFSGHILCHDQIEASFMHRAGYDVRVLAEESGSYEGVPPTLIDFFKRNHRWCRGNLKNLKLVGAPGLKLIDRFHLAVVAQRFLSYPALAAFVLVTALMAAHWPAANAFPAHRALEQFSLWLTMLFMPKILGVADAVLSSPARYGGVMRLIAGGSAELVFTLMLTAICAVETTLFILRLPFERATSWAPQARDGYTLSWGAALKAFWLSPMVAAALVAYLYHYNAAAIAWFAPFLVGLFLAVPLAKFTSSPRAGDGIFTLPEELDIPPVIADFARAAQPPR